MSTQTTCVARQNIGEWKGRRPDSIDIATSTRRDRAKETRSKDEWGGNSRTPSPLVTHHPLIIDHTQRLNFFGLQPRGPMDLTDHHHVPPGLRTSDRQRGWSLSLPVFHPLPRIRSRRLAPVPSTRRSKWYSSRTPRSPPPHCQSWS